MFEAIAAAQVPLLVFLLTMGATAKVTTARSDIEPGTLTRLGPAVLVPERWRTPALVVCAGGELLLAAGLAMTTLPFFRWGVLAFFSLSVYVLLELRRRRPDAGCGCFGEVSARPIGVRSIGRTVALAVMAAGSIWVPMSGWNVVSGLSWTVIGAMAGGLVVLAVLSPELEEAFARLRYRAPCEQRPFSPDTALARLRSSALWRSHEPLLVTGQPEDSWRELCWRFFAYSGRLPDGEAIDVVFAVYLSGRRAPVRVALVRADGLPVPSLPESIPVSA
ncbi:MauE/DoxX family redox-associated membrane protein [Streptosporangium soli]|nr:hypothetical protein [Streptosporangium sp. KLBMP 9127]